MRTHLLFSAPLALALAAACGGNSSKNVPEPVDPLNGTSWVLHELPARTLVGQGTVTVRFDQGKASGSDGCNRFIAPYAITESTIKFTMGPGTMMACPAPLMEQASAFHNALGRTGSYRVESDMLELLDANGKPTAKFRKQSSALAGTSWKVTGINNQRGGLESIATGSEPTLAFGTDGTVTGNASCNHFSGGFQQMGERIKFGALATTRRACTDEALNRQEANFLAAMSQVTTSRIEGSGLVLRDDKGAMQVTATAAE